MKNFMSWTRTGRFGRLPTRRRWRPVLERLERRDLFAVASVIAVGAGAGGGPEVTLLDRASGGVIQSFFAHDPGFTGGVRVAVGDMNGDGIADVVTAAGPGGGPQVKVFDGKTGQLIQAFFAFDPSFTGGVNVAVGDFNGDKIPDIVVGADAGGGPQVRIFDGKTGQPLASFFAYDPDFTGGVRVAVSDVNGDGRPDVVVGAGAGGGPQVRAFDGATLSQPAPTLLSAFFAYDPAFNGGVNVAASDLNADGKADIVTGPGAGGGPQVRVFDAATANLLSAFFAYDIGFTGGVQVGAISVDSTGRPGIITGPGSGGGMDVRVFDAPGGVPAALFSAFDPGFTGGAFVAASGLPAKLSQDSGGTIGDFFQTSTAAVYFASKNGCYADANLSDSTVGHDDSAALQALIDAPSAGTRKVIVIDGPMKLGNVRLRSGVTILGLGGSSYGATFPASGVIQAPNTVCVFRNDHWTSNYNNGNPVSDFSTIVDQDVTVRDLFINGNRGNGGVNNACGGNPDIRYVTGGDGYANPSKLPITPLMFFGVRNLRLENVWIYDPDTNAARVAYVDGLVIRGGTSIAPVAYAGRGSPGTIPGVAGSPGSFQVNGNVRNALIENISGYFNNVAVNLSTDSIAGATPYYPLIYPGPATDIEVHQLRVGVAEAFLRLWSGEGTFSSLIDRFLFDDASGTLYSALFYIDGPSATIGTHGTEVIRGLSATMNCGTIPIQFAGIEGTHTDLTLSDIHVQIDAASSVQGGAMFFVNAPITIMNISGLTVEDLTSLDYDLIQITGSPMQDVLVSDVAYHRTQPAACRLVHFGYVPGYGVPSLSNLSLDHVTLDRVANAVYYDFGNLANLTSVGLTHLNAGGNPSICVNGATLPRLRAAASNTALLAATANGGTITSKKTDGTEDA